MNDQGRGNDVGEKKVSLWVLTASQRLLLLGSMIRDAFDANSLQGNVIILVITNDTCPSLTFGQSGI